jgi:hypothetical protein
MRVQQRRSKASFWLATESTSREMQWRGADTISKGKAECSNPTRRSAVDWRGAVRFAWAKRFGAKQRVGAQWLGTVSDCFGSAGRGYGSLSQGGARFRIALAQEVIEGARADPGRGNVSECRVVWRNGWHGTSDTARRPEKVNSKAQEVLS